MDLFAFFGNFVCLNIFSYKLFNLILVGVCLCLFFGWGGCLGRILPQLAAGVAYAKNYCDGSEFSWAARGLSGVMLKQPPSATFRHSSPVASAVSFAISICVVSLLAT